MEQHWGEVLTVNFGSLESGALDDGCILLLTDMVAPLISGFKLMVDGRVFDYWVMEDCSVKDDFLVVPSPMLDSGHARPHGSSSSQVASSEVGHRDAHPISLLSNDGGLEILQGSVLCLPKVDGGMEVYLVDGFSDLGTRSKGLKGGPLLLAGPSGEGSPVEDHQNCLLLEIFMLAISNLLGEISCLSE
ncbi:hypothetical protein Dimus_017225 [Dionaea muscipula]